MKNKYLLLAVLAMFLGFSSCDDDLELFPENATAIELGFQNEADFEDAAKGLYSAFRRSGYYGATSGAASIYFIPDVMSDDVIINANGRRSREAFYDWQFDEQNSSETFWLSAYKVIQRANLILESIDNIEKTATRDNVEGQALAARGIAHFDLARLYASSPAQAADSELGIPYVTTTNSGELPSRNTLGETYTNILSDLNGAVALIGDDNGKGRLSKNVVNAILSRVHLFMGHHGSALTAANAVTGSEVSRGDFFNLWKDAAETGVIWKIETTEADNVSLGVAWFQESPDGIRSEYNPDFSLYSKYSDADIRKEVYFETSDFSGVTYNHMIKYRGRLSGNLNEVDAKVIRYSEILLTRAECMAEAGDDAGALAALDELRSNRYDGFAGGSETGSELKDAIALERRLELAFEGVRWFDLKRKGLPVERSDFGDAADGTGFEAEFKTLAPTDHRFNMAIGRGEMDANINMQQNPGY